jgi:hypothetical protein
MTKKITPKKKKPAETTALALPGTKEIAPSAFISQAITQGASVETMEKLMNLQDRWESKMAKRAFDEAMAKFQALCPTIKKDKTVNNKPDKDGRVTLRYKFAPLDSIVAQVKRILQDCGFSYTITAKMEGNQITAICKVTHSLGHSEESSFQVPTDPDAYMNIQQKVGAALTFAKRYAFCNAFGIMTGDEDVDANAVHTAVSAQPSNTDDVKRMKYINDLVAKKDLDGLVEARDQVKESEKLTNQEKMKWMGIINDHLKALKTK